MTDRLTFLKELLVSLDVLPKKNLGANTLQDGCLCDALGAVGRYRGIEMGHLSGDYDVLGKAFDISAGLAEEITNQNDNEAPVEPESVSMCFTRMRSWTVSEIAKAAP